MILKQAAQQLPPDRLQLSFERSMLKLGRLPRAQPPNDLLKPLARTGEPIPASTTTWTEIHPGSITTALALQEFISRRVKYAATGAGVGDHEPHLPGVDVVLATPTSAPTVLLLPPTTSAKAKPPRNSRHSPDPGRRSSAKSGCYRPSKLAAPK